jgi:aspartate-semialdehyde dehydrogenase
MNFAIIGASGNVGRKTIEILEKSKIPFKELYLVAQKKALEKKLNFEEKKLLLKI